MACITTATTPTVSAPPERHTILTLSNCQNLLRKLEAILQRHSITYKDPLSDKIFRWAAEVFQIAKKEYRDQDPDRLAREAITSLFHTILVDPIFHRPLIDPILAKGDCIWERSTFDLFKSADPTTYDENPPSHLLAKELIDLAYSEGLYPEPLSSESSCDIIPSSTKEVSLTKEHCETLLESPMGKHMLRFFCQQLGIKSFLIQQQQQLQADLVEGRELFNLCMQRMQELIDQTTASAEERIKEHEEALLTQLADIDAYYQEASDRLRTQITHIEARHCADVEGLKHRIHQDSASYAAAIKAMHETHEKAVSACQSQITTLAKNHAATVAAVQAKVSDAMAVASTLQRNLDIAKQNIVHQTREIHSLRNETTHLRAQVKELASADDGFFCSIM